MWPRGMVDLLLAGELISDCSRSQNWDASDPIPSESEPESAGFSVIVADIGSGIFLVTFAA